eukprot:TRINITY_DN2793_c0_g1_i3.p1 TRINITY_DN2793_c0_g1~~TRINITY_DN2793_c0_g1_i3.p1  ORF type:complete len:114 (-),score=9.14 TRINITY_DN2793_c0_g1_i3:49-390(-)
MSASGVQTTLAERQTKAKEVRSSGAVPLVIQFFQAANKVPIVRRYSIPSHLTITRIIARIGNEFGIPADQAIMLFAFGTRVISLALTGEELYRKYKGEDGFVNLGLGIIDSFG